MRVGILGGTFDPIHNGHLFLAKKALKKLKLDKIIFIPAYLAPHKTRIRVTPTAHRYNMVKLALFGEKKFEISDIEIKRKGKSYSIDTLRQFKRRYGQDTEIFFITGSDSLRGINKWKDLGGILRLCRFVVAKRPDFEIKNLPRDFIVIDIGAKNISASDIRDKVHEGADITGLVPKKVRDYIKRHSLYLA
ncbi:MAG: nicotinate-nucleotide adenylyltransferase [Candidatus Omnitrophota bacterium]